MTELETQLIKLEPGQIAIVISHEEKGTEEEALQYMVYDNSEYDPENVLPVLVRGLCHVASTNPKLIIEAYQDYVETTGDDVDSDDQPDWARNVGGSA